MSLRPREKQALSQIETWLRHSDPDLARKLERFGGQPPAPSIPGRDSFTPARRGPRRLRLLAMAVVVLLLAALWAIVIIRPHRPTPGKSCGTSAAQPARCHGAGGSARQPKAHPAGLSPAVHK